VLQCIIKVTEKKEDDMDRVCTVHGREGIAYKILVRNHEGKRPLWRTGFR
jgi:hypothetical protein